MKNIIIFLIKGYQFTFGRLFPRVCRFSPSCSNYAIEALQIHGVFRGSILSVLRILKCSPFFPGGWDPVPAKNIAAEYSFKYEKCHKEHTNE